MNLVLRREENVFPIKEKKGGGRPSVIKCEIGGGGLIPGKGVISYLNSPLSKIYREVFLRIVGNFRKVDCILFDDVNHNALDTFIILLVICS